MFLSIEGIDNIGKTTLCQNLTSILKESMEIVAISDPPKMEPWLGWKPQIEGDANIARSARTMLYLAARLDGYERVVKPALGRKAVVIADRYMDSWFAYHVMSLSKFTSKEEAFGFLLSIHNWLVSHGLMKEPDKTFLLIGDPSVTTKKDVGKNPSVYDDITTQTKIQDTYLWLSKKWSGNRIEIVDVGTKSEEEVTSLVYSMIQPLLK